MKTNKFQLKTGHPLRTIHWGHPIKTRTQSNPLKTSIENTILPNEHEQVSKHTIIPWGQSIEDNSKKESIEDSLKNTTLQWGQSAICPTSWHGGCKTHTINIHKWCHLYRNAHNGHSQHTPRWSPATWHIEKPSHGATYMADSATHAW